ncbi:hypothetical protein, partial [Streptococcus anginosus]|uniref:hypothetical protein n=1 Tax=Streptococcus anginosus TaxID=1328 RepID=UPI002EDB0751
MNPIFFLFSLPPFFPALSPFLFPPLLFETLSVYIAKINNERRPKDPRQSAKTPFLKFIYLFIHRWDYRVFIAS